MFYLIIIIATLFLSFYFSGTETAFVSVNKVRVEIWRRRKYPSAKPLLRFLKYPERFLYTTLIGNNISNIAFASFATIYFNNYWAPEISWIFIVLLSLFMGEIIPKTLFRSLADWIIRRVVYPLEFFHYIFYPLTYFIKRISQMVLWLFGHKEEELDEFFSEKDIEILLKESHQFVENGSRKDVKFIEKILNLKDIPVSEVMVPRADIITISQNSTIKNLHHLFRTEGISRIPVYGDDIDTITGIVFLKDLFLNPRSIKQILHPPMFVPTTKRSRELFTELRKNRTTIAIVIDEYGGASGLVTIEDLVEELFGEIEDEFDQKIKLIRKIDDKNFRINAKIEIAELNKKLKLAIPEGNYETLGGFLLSQTGHIPKRDETIVYDGLKIVVTRATRSRIQWVKLMLSERLV
jgi:CBS domain containing-hemolysin-like protein